MPSTSEGNISLVNWIRWKVQSRARARAWPSVVLPTPGTPSISRCPLAKMETRARRRTSSLPRMTVRRLFSSSAARREVATRASGAIRGDFTMRVAEVAVTNVIVRRRDLTHLVSPVHLCVPLCSLWFKHFFTTGNTEVHRENLPPKLFAVHGEQVACLLEEFRRSSRQPLDPFRGWRMRREQVAETHPS